MLVGKSTPSSAIIPWYNSSSDASTTMLHSRCDGLYMMIVLFGQQKFCIFVSVILRVQLIYTSLLHSLWKGVHTYAYVGVFKFTFCSYKRLFVLSGILNVPHFWLYLAILRRLLFLSTVSVRPFVHLSIHSFIYSSVHPFISASVLSVFCPSIHSYLWPSLCSCFYPSNPMDPSI